MAFTLAHLSDVHLAPLPRLSPAHIFSKRLFGYMNWWRGRDAIHRPEILLKLTDDIKLHKPDHIVVTGDLTNLGLTKEYEAVKLWLKTLGRVENVTVIPGNHDAYVPGALEKGLEMLAEWMRPEKQQPHLFPFVYLHEDIAVIATTSAIATRPFSAAGKMGPKQLDRIGVLLNQHKNKFRIVLVHHPLRVRASKHSKRLRDGEEFVALLREKGAELVLYGHMHESQHQIYHGPINDVHAFGVPSASADPLNSHRPAGYALYKIEGDLQQWKVHVTRRELSREGAFYTVEEKPVYFKK